jgi:hypothetical protein
MQYEFYSKAGNRGKGNGVTGEKLEEKKGNGKRGSY